MSCIVKDFDLKVYKSFTGYENYFNMTGLKNKLLFRREILHQDSDTDFILSDISDNNDCDIISSHKDPLWSHSYEDPRFISSNIFTFSMAYFNSEDTELIGCKMGYYNIKNKQLEIYNCNKKEWEKNWQIVNRRIVYMLEPLQIYKSTYEEYNVQRANKKWDIWKAKFGIPRLSTNIFNLQNKKYAIFHSKKVEEEDKSRSKLFGIAGKLKYFCGLVEVDKDYIPISYNIKPLLPSFDKFNLEQRKEYVEWRSRTNSTWTVDVFFPQNVEESRNSIKIYGGINDCNAVKLTIEKNYLVNQLRKEDFINLQ